MQNQRRQFHLEQVKVIFIHDSKKFSPMIREVSEQYDIDKVYADKAHDNKRSFQLLDGLN